MENEYSRFEDNLPMFFVREWGADFAIADCMPGWASPQSVVYVPLPSTSNDFEHGLSANASNASLIDSETAFSSILDNHFSNPTHRGDRCYDAYDIDPPEDRLVFSLEHWCQAPFTALIQDVPMIPDRAVQCGTLQSQNHPPNVNHLDQMLPIDDSVTAFRISTASTNASDVSRQRYSADQSLSGLDKEFSQHFLDKSKPRGTTPQQINSLEPHFNSMPLQRQQSSGRLICNAAREGGQQSYACDDPECGGIFTKQRSLERHRREVHGELRPFPCPHLECQYHSMPFKRQGTLDRHLARRHSKLTRHTVT